MRVLFAVAICLLFGVVSHAQFYYNDIISTQQSSANYKLMKQANISQVKGISFEADGTQAENFLVLQDFSRDKKRIITRATSPDNVTTITTAHFENDRLVKTVDSLVTVSTVTNYEYDAVGRVVRIRSHSADPDHDGTSTEEHQWSYKADGKPASGMLKIKNGADTVIVEFIYDEKGNVAEEIWKKKNILLEQYYYYYTEAGQVSDVVRYDLVSKKLLPDVTLDYDSAGRVVKMLQRINGTNNYLNWVYSYDERGLRQKEVCVDKNNRVVGRVEYTYSR